ncbi:MAG: hypothetical protein QG654_88 [Patescibacteria group bacterium]|nr:hypothetical protein [Patescibacteria group bacterium]
MKNTIKKLNIFAFVLVFSFSGLIANTVSADTDGNATFWNGTELVPIYFEGSSSNNNGNNNGNNNNDNGDQISTLSATNIDEDSAKLRGEVTDGSNVNVWFVIDNNDSTPSCSDDDLEYGVSGDFDDGDEFSRTVSNLDSDETYYFRACSDDDSGSVRSFTTDDNNNNNNDDDNNDDDNDNNNSSLDDIVALTSYATGVTTNSAYLNGVSIINNGGSGNAWFEYGITTAMGNRTPNQSIGTGTSNISRQILGLSQRTSYYFRLVIQNNEGTDYGDIETFKTGGVYVNTGSGNTPSAPTTPVVTTVTSPIFLALDINSNLDKVSVGDIVTYTISYKNVSGKDIKNVTMQVSLPKEVGLRKTTLGGYSKASHSVTVSVETLPKEAKGEFVIVVDVLKSALGESVLIASLLGAHDHPTVSGAKVDSLHYSIIEVDRGNVSQSASSIFAGKFFPTSFVGWLLIVLIIFFIVLIARKLAKDKEEREEKEKSEEGIKIAK